MFGIWIQPSNGDMLFKYKTFKSAKKQFVDCILKCSSYGLSCVLTLAEINNQNHIIKVIDEVKING